MRSLFVYLEESMDEAPQWAVFEPNHPTTWTCLRRSSSDFLTSGWLTGELQGPTADEAFFVHCERPTMTQDDKRVGG